MPYRTLDPQHIIATAERLELRVGERFGEAGLRGVAHELVGLARFIRDDAQRLRSPVIWLRIVIALIIFTGAAVFIFIGTFLSFDRLTSGGLDFVQGVEATINTLVLAGLGFFTLVRMEERFKRHAVFKGLHNLRSLIHIIDMHQLTKDPLAVRAEHRPTQSSPSRKLSATELTRYLDYASEMLAITGKLAALYAQALNDEVVAEAVNDIEGLGSNLSRKIWQKIMLIEPVNGVGGKGNPETGAALQKA